MNKKTIVITGANSGIGKETAREIARTGAKVVMVCRNPEKGEAAKRDIINDTKGDVDLLIADMSDLNSIEKLAQDLTAKYPRIDVLLHNAGVFCEKRIESVDGIEMTLATNHVGVFHLTNLMLPVMKASAPARIIIVSSEAHLKGRIELDDLEFKKRSFKFLHAYGQSKLLNLLHMKELEKKLEGSNVTINCVHPGVVATNIVKASSGKLLTTLFHVIAPFILTPEKGAKTSIKVALDPSLEKITGKYFEKERISKYNPIADNRDLAERSWIATENLIKAKFKKSL